MKIAIDPHMFRSTPLLELPGLVADLGYEYVEHSPGEDRARESATFMRQTIEKYVGRWAS